MDEWHVTIDGRERAVDSRKTVLDALTAEYIDLPHVCYHPDLGPIQTCDTCIVAVDGKLERACALPIRDGMQISTRDPEARAAQVEAMQRILHNHELYCTVCDNNNGDCVVHNTTELLQINHQKYPFEPKPYPKVDESHPFYTYNVDQCILCGRCVEACQDLEVNETLSIDWSLERPRVEWDHGVPAGESSCVSCGHCVTVCPCNALMEKSMLGQTGYLTAIPEPVLTPMIHIVQNAEPGFRPTLAVSDMESAMRRAHRVKRTKTVCTYCGVGCSFDIWTKGRHILQVAPTPEAPTNGISTCVKGKFGWDFVNSPKRLTKPLIRRGDHFEETDWDTALSVVARRLQEIKETYGPDSIAFVASSKGSNEEAYLVQKMARSVIGTNNVDNDSTYCQDPATFGLRRTVGHGADSGSLKDVEAADLVLIVGSNTAESHPVWATRVKRSHKLRGQKLIVADLRRHEMAERADVFLHPKPGTDLVWIQGVQKYLVDQGWIAKSFLKHRVNGLDEYLESLRPYTLDYVEEITGLAKSEIQTVAEMIHDAPSLAVLWAMGVTQQPGGSETSTALSNLLLLTGNYGRPGTGAYPLRGHNNVQGASDFGAKPLFLPGYQAVSDRLARERFEKAWGTPLPTGRGANNQELAGLIHEGVLKALYVVGEDIAVVDNDARHAQKAFAQVGFLVVHELFMTRTAEFADVVLPACPNLEKDGTFVNTERRIQRFYQALEPLGQSRPDWVILTELAHRMGHDWGYRHASDIMKEVSQLTPLFAGADYDRLERYRTLQWPVSADGTDEPLLYRERFPFPDGKARLVPVDYVPQTSGQEGYDIHVNNGDLLEHFHEGNMTYRVRGIRELVPEVFIEVSAELAAERQIRDGTLLRLESPTGAVELPAVISDRVTGHEVYVPLNNDQDRAVNLITGRRVDVNTGTPAYKDTAVRLTVVDPAVVEDEPLPRANWRYHQRHPQIGVRVQDKWDREDYAPLTTEQKNGREGRGATDK